jgi:hypothetical protein
LGVCAVAERGSARQHGDCPGAARSSAQCGVEARAQVGEPFGGFVGEDQVQVPAAAGPPAVHRGGGDLGASEQPPGCFPGSEAQAAGVDEQRPAAVRPDARIPGELVQDQCAALLPDPGGCCDIGAIFRVVQGGGDGLLGAASAASPTLSTPIPGMSRSRETVIAPSQTSLITARHGAPIIQLRAAPCHRNPQDSAGHSGGYPRLLH